MAFTILTQPNAFAAVGSPMPLQVQAPAGWEASPTYVFEVSVFEKDWDTGLFTEVIITRIKPGADDIATLNFSPYLASVLSADPPDIDTPNQTRQNKNMIRRYQYSIVELIDETQQSYQISAKKYVVRAVVPWMDTTADTIGDAKANGTFLTRQPRTKTVSACQPEFLSLILPKDTTTVHVKVITTGSDGSQASVDPGISYTGVENDVATFPAGFEQLGLDDEVIAWNVQIEDQAGNPISEFMNYEIDCGWSEIQRFYLFENSLGGYDTLRTTGILSSNQATQRQTAQKIPALVGYAQQRTRFAFQHRHRNSYLQNSGWLQDSEWAREILSSADVYRIGTTEQPNPDAAGDLHPIILTDSSTETHKDHVFLKAIRFAYEDGFTNLGL